MMSAVAHDTDPEKTQPDPPEGAEKVYAAPRKPPKAIEASTLPNANVVINVTRELTQPVLSPPPVLATPEPEVVRPKRSQKDIDTFVSRPSPASAPAANRSVVIGIGFVVGVLFVGIAAVAVVMGGGEKKSVAPAATATATAAATATATTTVTAAAAAPATASATVTEPVATAAPAPADPNVGSAKKPASSAAPKASGPAATAKPGNFVEPERTF